MHTIAELLRTRRDEVLGEWTTRASRAAAARGLTRPEFHNVFPKLIDAIAADDYPLGTFSGRPKEMLSRHIATRLRQGFQLAEAVDELRVLGDCVVELAARLPEAQRPSAQQIGCLLRELQSASVEAAELFSSHMQEAEQLEKRYYRLIQTAVLAASRPDPASLRARLEDVLALVMEAMGAQCAALMVFDRETERLEVAAATGLAKDAVNEQVSGLRPSSFVGKTAASEETTEVTDAATTTLEVDDGLRRSGIHALLGVRLPPRHALVGVLYVGLTEVRPFSAREISRLEALGEQLTLHLDNARLFAELRKEREAREQTVSMIAHDLRGPLATAKAAAQALARAPAKLEELVELATRIDRNVDRVDRMLLDMLDARRLVAGERPRIGAHSCDLGAIAAEVLAELRGPCGDRFDLRVEGNARGYWSADELRRAIWNLATNAVKFGDTRAPVQVRVVGGRDVCVSVHNEGAPIANEDRADLFEPFRRSRAPRAGSPRGWGLGLALVRAAAEAHGGRVRVDSSAERGTTFTIELPRDARRSRVRERDARDSIPSAPP